MPTPSPAVFYHFARSFHVNIRHVVVPANDQALAFLREHRIFAAGLRGKCRKVAHIYVALFDGRSAVKTGQSVQNSGLPTIQRTIEMQNRIGIAFAAVALLDRAFNPRYCRFIYRFNYTIIGANCKAVSRLRLPVSRAHRRANTAFPILPQR